jgi:ureidoacrylate peracid hydrolase
VRFAAELGYEVTLVNDAIDHSFGLAETDASLKFNMPVICERNIVI